MDEASENNILRQWVWGEHITSSGSKRKLLDSHRPCTNAFLILTERLVVHRGAQSREASLGVPMVPGTGKWLNLLYHMPYRQGCSGGWRDHSREGICLASGQPRFRESGTDSKSRALANCLQFISHGFVFLEMVSICFSGYEKRKSSSKV